MTLSDMDIDAIHIETWEEMKQVVAALKTKPGKCELNGKVYETVFIDSLGPGCGDLWMDAGKKVLGWDDVWAQERGKDPRRIYSYISEKGQQAMKMFLGIEAHVVMTSRTTMLEESLGFDEKGHEIKQQYEVPLLPGQQLPKILTGDPDAVLYGDWRGTRRVLRTRNQGKRVSRVRLPGSITLPDPIAVDMDALIRVMLGDTSMLQRLALSAPDKA